jgi:hypothetical protein
MRIELNILLDLPASTKNRAIQRVQHAQGDQKRNYKACSAQSQLREVIQRFHRVQLDQLLWTQNQTKSKIYQNVHQSDN